jgi:hypothetical protein
MKKTYTAIAAGAILGIIGARFLFVGSWLNLIPWSLAGIAIGYWGTRNEAMINGVVYGFILSFAFMIAGYSGKLSLISRVPFFAVLGVFGGVCGLGLGLLGFFAKTKISKSRRKS